MERDTSWNQDDVLRGLMYALGLYLTGLLLYYAYTLQIERLRYLNLFVGPGIALFYLHNHQRDRDAVLPEREISTLVIPTEFDGDRFPLVGRIYGAFVDRAAAFDIVFAVLALSTTVYIEFHFERLRFEAPITGTTIVDQLVGLVLVVIVIHATKVAYGWAISLATVVAIVYALAGPLFPGIFNHTGMSLSQLAVTSAIGLRGIFGFIMSIGATWVAVFIVFAGIAKSFGLIDYILSIGEEASKLFRSGIVHAAVISSLFIGSLTGSAAANTATTGSFTIPMMIQQGVDDEYAAAIESVASSGAQVMPPVMGVAAFLMADILGVSYVDVIAAGLLPAILFYAAIAIGIHLLILRLEWTVEAVNRPDPRTFVSGAYFVIPLGVLLYTLVVMRLTPLSAGFYTIVSLVGVQVIRNVVVESAIVATRQTVVDILEGGVQGALEMAPLVGVLGAMGIIVEIINETGLSQKLSSRIIGLAAGVFLILLLLAMVISILFGLGMPTPAAYILVVFLVAPALVESGVQDLTAHFFVFYFAMLSAITPPVAICVAISSRIANVGFVPTATQALRIGGPAFVLPYVFLTNDSLIFWVFPSTVFTFGVVLVGFGLLAMALVGYDGQDTLWMGVRAAYAVLAGGAFFAPPMGQVASCIIGAIVFILFRWSSTPSWLTRLG